MEGLNEHPYKSYVRGKEIDFSPANIRRVMRFKEATPGVENNYDNRQGYDQQLDQVLRDLCIPGATWKMGKGRDPKPIQLRRQELLPLARGWQEFIIYNIFPIGNKSKVTTTRAVLIHSIIKGDDIRVENLTADSIILITQGLGRKGKLGFPSTIYKLCNDAKVRMREFSNLDLIPKGRYTTAEVMETVRVPRIVQQHQPRNEDEDHEMPEYEPENETDFDNLQHEQEHHQFEQPPQQQYHYQQPPYEDYHQYQQTMMEQQQQGFNSINEMLDGIQLQQENMFQGLQTTQNQYLEKLRALKTRKDEFFSNQNNQYNMIRQKQDLMAKEIQDLKKYQVNTTMMGANKNEIDQLVSKVGEQQHLFTEAMKQLKEWTRNASARECYSVWAHQQANPNLVEMPVYKVTKQIYKNLDADRPMFHGFLKSEGKMDKEAGKSWKIENQSKRPRPGANSSHLGMGHQVSTLPITSKHPSSHAQV
ncbi:hypothetical protein PIB30_066389 [Stylosanthes scabra]|uniref:Putative plant transposon protein domain-containing protein n=1 Tax=Stylosanthes scabra TaxID=79078 RepID=A0ABU6WQL5_9FABA|nr:hypothetical protein [Stylosanthes scabra]